MSWMDIFKILRICPQSSHFSAHFPKWKLRLQCPLSVAMPATSNHFCNLFRSNLRILGPYIFNEIPTFPNFCIFLLGANKLTYDNLTLSFTTGRPGHGHRRWRLWRWRHCWRWRCWRQVRLDGIWSNDLSTIDVIILVLYNIMSDIVPDFLKQQQY